MIQQLISWLTGAPVEQVGMYFREKQQLKHELNKAKLEGKIEVARAEAASKAAQAQHFANWEMASLQNSGWKDEFVLLTISYPVYASFIPPLAPGVAEGFKILGTTPAWYMGMVLAVYLAIYGIRWHGASKLRLSNETT